jgi:hypothetical protein
MNNNIEKLWCVEKEQLFAHELVGINFHAMTSAHYNVGFIYAPKIILGFFAISVRDCRRFTVDAWSPVAC